MINKYYIFIIIHSNEFKINNNLLFINIGLTVHIWAYIKISMYQP